MSIHLGAHFFVWGNRVDKVSLLRNEGLYNAAKIISRVDKHTSDYWVCICSIELLVFLSICVYWRKNGLFDFASVYQLS